jgi:EpsI family protein
MQARLAIVLLVLVGGAAAVARADRYEQIPIRTSFAHFPMTLGSWQGVLQPPMAERELEVLGADDYLLRAFFGPDKRGIGLYVGYWQSQRTGDTIHSPLNCLPGAGWEPMSATRIEVPDPRGGGREPMRLNRVLIQKGLERQLVLYWYQSHGRLVASEYWGKIYMVVDAVRMNRTDGAIVRVIAPVDGTGDEAVTRAEALGMAFIADLLPALDAFLPE